MPTSTSLQGQNVLITGAAKRIGRALALGLARSGASIVIHHRSSGDEASALAGEITQMGTSAWIVAGDLAEPSDSERVFAEALAHAGQIDVLINNASLYPEDNFTNLTADSLTENVNVNALAPFLLARAFAAQGKPGNIINLLDTRIQDYDAKHLSYHLSKHMLYTMTRLLALELAPHVRVNGVAPGLIIPPVGEDEEYLKKLADTNPLDMHGGPEDIVASVAYLLGARFVTGQVIYVDGGRHMLGGVYG